MRVRVGTVRRQSWKALFCCPREAQLEVSSGRSTILIWIVYQNRNMWFKFVNFAVWFEFINFVAETSPGQQVFEAK